MDAGTMVRRLGALGVLALAGSGAAFAKVDVSRRGADTTMHFVVDGVAMTPVTISEASFLRPSLVGVDGYQGVTQTLGSPELPVIRFFVRGDVEVEVGGTVSTQRLARGQRLVPTQPSRIKTAAPAAPLALDAEAYAADFRRTVAYSVEPAGSVNGVAQQLVTLYPMDYAPTKGQWSLRRSFSVKVHASEERSDGPARERFVFLVGERFRDSAALAAYANLKEDMGYLVERLVVTAQDNPDTIRHRLQQVYARPDAKLRHALIIGDAEDVPGYASQIISGVTDHYYRAIDTADYEGDINGPDIGVGRVAVGSEAELAAVLDKFKRYIDGKFSNEAWLNGIAWLATDDQYEVAEGTHNYVIDTYAAAAGYKGVFPQADQAGGDKLYAVTYHVPDSKVLEVMGTGRTVIDYSGHGSTNSWAAPGVTQDDVRSLADPNALPFVISNACVTGQFTEAESFGETWQRHPNGAIMFWGSMDSTYWDEDDILERRMFDGIFRDRKLSFEALTNYAESEVWRFYGGEGKSKYYWETYVTFGDPSLELRTTPTRQVQLAGPLTAPVGTAEVVYVVTDGAGGPVVGARVSLSLAGGGFKAAGVTDGQGRVVFDVSAATRDVATLDLTVSGANTRLFTAKLNVIAVDTPYLGLSEFGLSGRPNLDIYIGEAAALRFKIENVGMKPTSGGKLELATVDGPVRVLGENVKFPALAPQETWRVSGDDLMVTLLPTAAAGTPAHLALLWTTDEGVTSKTSVVLHIVRGDTQVIGVDFGGAEGIAPGTTGNLFVTIENRGNEVIRSGVLRGLSGPCVDAVSGELAIDNLAPGAKVRLDAPLAVQVDGTCQHGDRAAFSLEGTYASAVAPVGLKTVANFGVGTPTTTSVHLGDLNLRIPDDGPAVAAPIPVTKHGLVKEVGVHVALTHSYIGDLAIQLVHPDGTSVTLFDHTDGGADDLDATWGLGGEALPALGIFAGKAAEGNWQVTVQDNEPQDSGTLDTVDLTLKGFLSP